MSTPTKEETQWMRRLEKVLTEAPTRIGIYTIGDAYLQIYDREMEDEIHVIMDKRNCDFCQAVQYLDASLGTVDAPINIHSTCG